MTDTNGPGQIDLLAALAKSVERARADRKRRDALAASAGHMVGWPTRLRGRLTERECPHGIGHPDPNSPAMRDGHDGIHGCDGCCTPQGDQR